MQLKGKSDELQERFYCYLGTLGMETTKRNRLALLDRAIGCNEDYKLECSGFGKIADI